IATDSEEVSRTALIQIFLLFRIQIQYGGVSLGMSDLASYQASGIVTTHLDRTCPVRSRTVVLTKHAHLRGLESTLEIRTYRSDKYHKHIFGSRLHTHLSAQADHQRTNI